MPIPFFSYQQRCGINAGPTAQFGVRLWAVVAGPLARHEQFSSESVAGGFLVVEMPERRRQLFAR